MAAKRRKKKLGARRNKMLGAIHRKSAAAAILRLKGKIPGAMRYEEEVDRLVGTAERQGWGDKAFDRQMRGTQAGHRAFAEKKVP